MAEEGKTFQPGWGEKKKHHHHHRYDHRSKERNRGLGGALRMRDKQAYIGLMIVCAVVAIAGIVSLFKLIRDELRAIPNDDPTMELNVDELRIHKADEQDALLIGDSLAQAYNVDSLRHNVQIETRPVYRPPRKNNEWYLTQREWKSIWKNYKIWKRMNAKDKEKSEEGKGKN